MGLKLEGMSTLLKELKKAGEKGQNIAYEALKAGAEILKSEMSKRVNRSELNKRHLAENIIISKIKDGILDVGPHQDFFYGFFLEFGTSKMQAYPFAEPAFNACKDRIQDEMMKVIKKGLGL